MLWTVWVMASMKLEEPGTAGQVQADVVGVNGDQFGALAGFGARQVHTWQGGLQKGCGCRRAEACAGTVKSFFHVFGGWQVASAPHRDRRE
jgi:hypothetical protein